MEQVVGSDPVEPENDVPGGNTSPPSSESGGGDQQRSRSPSAERQHTHPAGWSLQDEEYESWEEEYDEGEDELSPPSPQSGSDSGQEEVNERLRELQYCVESDCKDFLYACGGTVPIIQEDQEEELLAHEETHSRSGSSSSKSSSASSFLSATPYPRIALRWDPQDPSTSASQSKLSFPPDKATAGNLEHLLAEMKPATFGLGGEDVYDESYRKASKLEPQHFSTNFCPYNAGIMEIISQVLLPNSESYTPRAIKAELYKLNVYTGPSGHFRSHVDTPRSRAQFGSLVVCLPVKHEGGVLEVRHDDETMSFDWAAGSEKPQIQWAAFFSDCEHEVFPVHSGYRITLTYNLYVTRGNAQLFGGPNSLNHGQTPLYQEIEALINDETFLPDGGYLGFYTTHAYPHNTLEGCLADTLKGLDMVIWQVFQHLGCGVCLRPVLAASPFWGEELWFKVGKNFNLKVIEGCIEEIPHWEQMLRNDWELERVSFEDIVWLNEPTLETKQAAFAFAAYGNEANSRLAYTICSIIVGVPKFHEGKRMKLTTTYATRFEEVDWEKRPPYGDDNERW